MDYNYEYGEEWYDVYGGEDLNPEEHTSEHHKWYEEIPRWVSEPDFAGDEISYTYDYSEEGRMERIKLVEKLSKDDERLTCRKMLVLSLIVKFVGKGTVSGMKKTLTRPVQG